MKRRIEDINEKIKKEDVAVISADDLSDMLRNGEDVKIKDVDVVTTATRGCMSGTAVLSFRFSDQGYLREEDGQIEWDTCDSRTCTENVRDI
jgi:uncharacterized protein (DUF39 family)